jgi:hypothetical protein
VAMLNPFIALPADTKSGFNSPIPSSKLVVVMPRPEKSATSSRLLLSEPTPSATYNSPGLSGLPKAGPSFPIAEITITPFAVSSSIFSINGMSLESLLAVLRFTMSISFSRTKLKASRNQEV